MFIFQEALNPLFNNIEPSLLRFYPIQVVLSYAT